MTAYLLLLLIFSIIICYFYSIGGGKFISSHQSSNEPLLCTCRFLTRDWRKT